MDSADAFMEMDKEFDSSVEFQTPDSIESNARFCDKNTEELARNILSDPNTRKRVLKAIAGVSHGSMMYPSLKNCIGYFKLANPISKVAFMKAYGKTISAPHVKRKMPTAHLTYANVTYKSFPLEIKHPEVVSYVFQILNVLTGGQPIAHTTPKLAELKILDKRYTWRKLKTQNITVLPGPSQRHFLRLLDRLFFYYKPKNNPDDIVPQDETDIAVSKKTTSIELENLFRDLDLQMEYSVESFDDDADDDESFENCTPAEKRAIRKKRKAKRKHAAPKSSIDNDSSSFALLMHVTVILINPTDGKKSIQDVTREKNRVLEYLNGQYSGPGIAIGTTVHSINVVGEIRIPCLTKLDVEKFQASLIANVVKNKNIGKAGNEIMKTSQRKAMNKFPSLQVSVCNLYGKKMADVTLQIYESGYISITGPKTRSNLYEYYPGIMLVLYLAALNKEQLVEFMERSLVDDAKHRQITYQFDKEDTETKLDEEYRKEKIYGTGSIQGKDLTSSSTKKRRGSKGGEQTKQASFRKSDLGNPKKKFEARYNARFSTNFEILSNGDFRTTEWSSEVLRVFSFHEFSDASGVSNWIQLASSLNKN